MKALFISIGLLYAVAGTIVPYPAEYRKWTHVKSTLIGSEHPRFATNGGLHHFYANDKALEGYQSGKFPDGAVLVDDLLEVRDAGGGVTTEGTRRRVAVMMKDQVRFRDSGGWGFEIFKGDESAPSLNAEGKAACFACHGKQKDHDLVYSQYRK
jgi:hypothetical protein